MTRRAGDGAGLLAALRFAVDNLAAHVDEVNALNVFPVPDGDTGSNMLATIRAALAEAESAPEKTAERIAAAISFGALMGARGNSGVIASQIFRGMAEGLGGKQTFGGHELAHALNQGTATAYKAVVKPVEGTILTVIREASEAAVVAADQGGDLEDVLIAAVGGAREAVARTPSLLAVLRDAGVVDAGGQGLYYILEGTLKYLQARTGSGLSAATRAEPGELAGVAARDGVAPGTAVGFAAVAVPADTGFGYETMFMLQSRGAPLDVDGLRSELEQLGESVLVAGDARAVKVHVHSDRPDHVIALGLTRGALTRITVENLDAQSQGVRERRVAEESAGGQSEAHPRPQEPHRDSFGHAGHVEARPHFDVGTLALPASGAAVATDAGRNGSGASGQVAAGLGGAAVAALAEVESVPLAVVAVTAGDGLARIFASYGVAAVVRGGQSNNPSTGELLDAVEKIRADEILLLPNNPNVVLVARQASELTTHKVRVVPTRNAAEGFAALLALDPNRDATANAEVMTIAGRAVQTLQVTEAVRDALVGNHKVRKGQTIVLDPDDGLLAVNNDSVRAVLAALKALDQGFELVSVYYGEGVEKVDADALAKRIVDWRSDVEVEVVAGGQPHYSFLIAAE